MDFASVFIIFLRLKKHLIKKIFFVELPSAVYVSRKAIQTI